MRAFLPQKLPRPRDLRPLGLNPHLPVDVEIGCGVGFHPLRYARENPGRQLVAIERTKEKFEKFLGRLAHHEPMPNLFPVHGDARSWITHAFGPQSVSQYFILYPNPHPKESQRNQRFHNMPFFSQLLYTLKPGGLVTIATNMEFYAEEAAKVVSGQWALKLDSYELVSSSQAPRTHFEKKYLARGESCWNLVFSKPLT